MSKKNPKPLRDSEIEFQLSQLLYSSEDEDFDNEPVGSFATSSYNVDLDERLDEIQGISIEELHSVLVGESDLSLIQDETQLNLPVQHDYMPILPQVAQAVPSHLFSEVSMPHDQHAAETASFVAEADMQTEHSSPVPVLPEPNEHHNAERTSFCRDRFNQLQNKSRDWSFAIDNITWPIFKKEMRVKKKYTNRSQPLDYFLDFFPDELLDIIVENTNIYSRHIHSKAWTDVTKEEIKAYFGVIILMSINPLADLNTYWSSDEFFRNPVICKVIPLKRFKKITQNLHISNISTEAPRNSPDYDKLGKIRPAITILNKNFRDNVEVSAFNSIDESMIRFKGRSSMKQYMPKKPIKRGYKCWARADSRTGYLYEFQFYTGRIDAGTEENLGARVVLDLCEALPRHTLVAFDNFFTSLPLMEILHEKDIYSVGTLRINRKGLPDLITGKNLTRDEKKETALKAGEFLYQFNSPIGVMKWKDTKDVFIGATGFDPRAVELIERKQKDGSKKEIYCPLSIKKYTEFMGGVDHFDHFRASYPLGRKSRKNWHRLFWFLMEAAVINSYIVYMESHSERRNTHKEFRLRLGRGLINNFSSRKILAPVFRNKKGGAISVPEEIRKADVGSHMPQLSKFRRCRMCSTREKEQRSKYTCKICKVSLCAAPCFENFHK